MNLPDSFKAFLEAQKKPASKVTVKNYLADINQFIRWYQSNYNNAFHPSLLTPEVIDAFKKAHTDQSPSSLERKLSTLRKFSHFLVEAGHISLSPFNLTANAVKPQDPWRLNEFKNELLTSKASDLTIKNYINDVKQFTEWVAKNTPQTDDISSSINSDLLNQFRAAMIHGSGLSEVSINRKLSSLRRYFSFTQPKGIAKEDVLVSNISPIKTQQTINPTANQALKTPLPEVKRNDLLPLAQEQEKTSLPVSHKPKSTYSKFPPFRLAQKLALLVTLGFDATIVALAAVAIEKFHYLSWIASGKQIFVSSAKDRFSFISRLSESIKAGIALESSSLNTLLNHSSHNAAAAPKLSRVHPAHPGFAQLPKHLQLWGHARHTRPNWYKRYHSYPVVHYFHFAALIIIMSAIGFGMYQSVVQNAQKNQTLAATPPNAPPRILSFQGRLTDSSDNPITSAKDLRFAIYNDVSASGAALLWQETQYITPDQDGIFSVLLGSSTSIPASVFTDQTGLYLGITVQSDSELTPRQQIATVAFAANSETLQGLYPITAAGAGQTNVVLALDSSGNLTIGGSANPTFSATGGSFTLSGKTLNLNSTSGSNGNVSVSPDGSGLVLLNAPIQNTSNKNNVATAIGAVEVDDLFAVLATSSGQSAFTLNQASTGPIFSASVSGAAKFSIANSGVITANNYSTGVAQFDANGVLSSSALNLASGTLVTGTLSSTNGGTGANLSAATQGSVPYFSATGVMSALAPGTSGYVLTTNGAGANPTWTAASTLGTNYWQLNTNALSPVNNTYDVLFGSAATSSAKFALLNQAGGTPVASAAGNFIVMPYTSGASQLGGNVGIGSTAPSHLLVTTQTASTSKRSAYFEMTGGSTGTEYIVGQFNVAGAGAQLPAIAISSNGTVGLKLTHSSSFAVGTIDQNYSSATGLAFAVRGSEKGRFDNNGNLGIGSTSPIGLINVNGAATGKALAIFNQNGGDQAIFTASKSGATKFLIDTNGNVGIGTTTTSYNLDVAGNGRFTGTVVGANATLSNEFVTLGQLSSGTGQYWQLNSNVLAPSNTTFDLTLGGSATSSAKFQVYALANGAITAGTASTSGDLTFNGASATQDINLLNGTNLAIRTASTGQGDAGLTTRVTVLNNGNVGIGSTIPGAKLQVAGGNILLDSGAAASNYIGSSINYAYLPQDNGGRGLLNSAGSFYVNIDSNNDGNASVFQVAKDNTAASAGTQLFTVTESGNVGIGTSTPLGLLNVTGSTTTAQGQALVNLNQTGTASIFTASNSGTMRFDLAANGSIIQTATSTTGNAYTLNANSLTTGTGFAVSSTSTGLTTGGLGSFDWSPGSSTTSTGDLLSLNIGANGTIGNIFNVKDNSSSVFSVSQSQITAALPTSFTAAGDTSFAYDINFTNATSAYIKSAAPLYIQAGETFNSSDLILGTYNAGNVIVDSQALVANQSASISSQLVVGTSTAPANIGNFYLTNSATFGKALAILNQTESQDIFTASASGTNKFSISSAGVLTAPNYTTNGGLLYTNGSGVVAQTGAGTGTQCLLGGTTPTWGACSTGGGITGSGTLNYIPKFTPDGSTLGNSSVFDNGNVGIGTTVPIALLDLRGTAGAPSLSADTNNIFNIKTATTPELAFGGYSASPYAMWMQVKRTSNDGTSWPLAIQPLGGNVGIGTSDPSTLLDVAGNTNIQGYATVSASLSVGAYNAPSGVGNALFSGNVGIGTTTNNVPLAIGSSAGSNILFNQNTSTLTDFRWTTDARLSISTNATVSFGASYAAGSDAGIKLGSSGNGYSYVVGGTNLLLNPVAGNVGVGTTLPVARFEVKATGNGKGVAALNGDGNQPLLTASISGTNKFIVDSTGNVGIGLSAPLTALDTVGTIRAVTSGEASSVSRGIQLIPAAFNGTDIIRGWVNGGRLQLETSNTGGSGSGNAYVSLGSSGTSSDIRFATSPNSTATERMRLDSAGNLGIGTTTVNSLVEVNGTTTGNALVRLVQNTSGADIFTASAGATTRFVIQNGGNVGIGSAFPGYLLDVAGGSGIVAQFSGRVIGANAVNSNEFVTLSQLTGGTGQYWQRANGTLAPTNITDDVLIGGISTASAKFAFLNMAAGTPTASISSNLSLQVPTGNSPAATFNILNGGSLNIKTATLGQGDAGLTTALFIQNNGNIGVGTTSTLAKVTLSGGDNSTGTNNTPTLALGYLNTNQYASFIRTRHNAGTNVNNAIDFYTGDGTAAGVFPTNAIQTLTLNGGNVGIGTTTPPNLVYITGGTRGGNAAVIIDQRGASTNDIFTASASGTSRFVIANNGNVGIGTNLPASKLQITGGSVLIDNGQTYQAKRNTGGATINVLGFASGTDNLELRLGGSSGEALNIINTGGSTVFSLQGLGRLGLGTTTPIATLDVRPANGSVNAFGGTIAIASVSGATSYAALVADNTGLGDIFTASKSGSTKFVIANSGNVGIGSISPTYLFDVAGGSGIVAQFSGRVIGGSAVNSNEFVTLSQLTGGTGQYWQRANGTLSPTNITDDVLIGGTANATASALIKLSGTNNTNSFFNLGSGNLGIGTTNPLAKLDISGSASISGDLTFLGTSFLKTLNGGSFSFQTSPGGDAGLATKMTLLNNGNLGIGSTSPLGLFNLDGAATGKALAIINQNGGDQAIFTASKSGATKFIIDNGGNVGVGTAAPSALLDVTASYPSSSNTYIAKIINTSGSLGGGLDIETTDGGNGGNALNVVTFRGVTPQTLLRIPNYVSGNSSIFLAETSGTKVGVGTTTPNAKLDVVGDASVSASLVFGVAGTNTIDVLNGDRLDFQTSPGGDAGVATKMTLLNNGNLGIGSTLPGAKLVVSSTGEVAQFGSTSLTDQYLTFRPGGTGGVYFGLSSSLNGGSGGLVIQAGSNKTLNFTTNSDTFGATPQMVLSTAGNLGIGSTTPIAKLDVVGDASVSASLVFGVAGTNTIDVLNGDRLDFQTSPGGDAGVATRMSLSSNGNLGIGSTTPYSKLDVQGQITGGIGAQTTAGTLDWNDTSNTRSGNGYSLLLGSATNGPSAAGGNYFHPFNFEYNTKNGGGNVTQLAIPYGISSTIDQGIYMRGRYSGTWSNWVKIISENTNGNVGIGTTVALGKLDIEGTYTSAQGQALVQLNQLGTADIFTASQAGTTKFVINNSGNIGIGSAFPGYLLDVSGGSGIVAQFSGRVIGGDAVNSNEFATLGQIAAGAGQYWQRLNGVLSPSNITDDLAIGGTATSTATFKVFSLAYNNGFQTVPSGTASISGNLVFDSSTAQNIDILKGTALNFRTSPGGDAGLTSRLTLTSNGNFGIGTTTPSQKLAINGNLAFANATSNTIFYGTNGVAAPGANSAGEKIQLYGTSGTVGSTDYALGIESSNLWINTGGGIKFYTSATQRAVLTSAGLFGIGNTTPLTALDVTGSASFSGNMTFRGASTTHTINAIENGAFNFQTSTTGQGDAGLISRMFISNAGNVGIGSTAPGQKLNIFSGAIRFDSLANPGAPTVALAGLGAGNLSNGAYQYLIGMVTALGEQNATTASSVVTITDNTVDGQIQLSGIPVGTNGLVLARRVYRLDPGASAYRLVATINDNSTTTYTDNLPSSALGAQRTGLNTTSGDFFANGTTRAFYINTSGNIGLGSGLTAQFPTQRLYLTSGNNIAVEMGAPTTVNVVPANDVNGTLTAGTYYFRIVPFDGSGGVASSSADTACTVDGATTNACSINWTAVTGATGYRIYKGTSPGGQTMYKTANINNTTFDWLSDTGATTGLLPVSVNSYGLKLSGNSTSYFLGGNVGIGTGNPTAILHINPVKIASTAAATGTAGGTTLAVAGQAGGDTFIGTTGTGGAGGGVSLTTGAGGSASAALTLSTGGAGGTLTFTGGLGGLANINGTGNNTGGAGGAFTWTAGTGGAATGDTTGVNTAGNGGAITITAGTGGAASNANAVPGNVVGGTGGTLTLAGGTGGVGVTSGGNGGAVAINGGVAAAMAGAAGGSITLTGRAGSSTGTGGAGGGITLTAGAAGGDNTVNRAGGAISITAGAAKGPSQAGGAVSFTSGAGGQNTSTGTASGPNSGGVTFTLGTAGTAPNADVLATGGTGGTFTITGGAGGASGVAGTGANTGGIGSAFTWTSGAGGAANGATSGTNTGGAGGAITLTAGTGGAATAGSGSLVGGTGGAITLRAGTGGAGSTGGTGGLMTLAGGNAGVAAGTGGGLTLAAGVGGASGTGGTINLQTATTNTLATRMTILPGGNVGIGSTTPGGLFAVRSSTAATPIATFSAGISPTVDMVSITNGSFPVTTAGISALQVNFFGGAAAVESSAIRLDLTPGTTTGGTWNGYRTVAAATGPASGVNENLVKLEGPTSAGFAGVLTGINFSNVGAGSGTTDTALKIGTGWDYALTAASGNVGIGSTLPAYLLDVSGGSGIVAQFSGRVIGGDAVNSNEFATLGQIAAGAGQYWQRLNGVLSPSNITDDILFGGTSTASAKFAFINNIGAGTPTASISGNIVLNSTGTIQTTKNQSLTIGGNTTGNIIFNPSSTNNVGIGMTLPGSDLQVNGTTALGYSGFTTGPANGLAVSGNVGIGSTAPGFALDVPSGDFRTGNSITRSISRTLPTVVNDEVDIGDFTISNGSSTLDVSVVVPSSGFSISKRYILPIQYHATSGSWTIAQPISDTGVYGTNNIDLDINVTNGVASLRLRRTGGSTAGTAYVTVTQQGQNTATFTSSTATSSVSAPTSYFEGTALTQINGNVGIGTIAPSQVLDVQGGFLLGNGTGTGQINTSAWDISTAGAFSGITTINMSGQLTNTVSTGTAPFVISSTTKVTNLNADLLDGIDSTGFCQTSGAGCPASSSYWQLNSNVLSPGNSTHDLAIGGTATTSAKFQVLALTNGSITAGTASTSGDLTFNGTSATQNINVLKGTNLAFRTATTGQGDAGLTTRVTIQNDGNVGIGITTPSSKLHLSDTTRTITGNVSGTTQANLALTASDAQAADIGSTIGFGGQYINSNTTNIMYAAIAGRKANSTSGNADGYLSFNVWNGASGLLERMRIDTNGNVGIGTSAPIGKFNVDGAATGKALAIFNQNGGNQAVLTASISGATKFLVDSTGNVGIGTTTIADALTVNGNTNLTTGNAYEIAGASVLNATTLGTGVVTSSLTTVGALNSGSITSGFGSIDVGTDSIITTGTIGSASNTAFTGNTLVLTGQLTSSVTTGTAPFVIASTTKVTNLNADLLDGLDSTDFCRSTGANCPATAANYWQLNNNVISPGNSTQDMAIGGTATSSAVFQVFALANGSTPAGTATMSGNLVLNSVASIQTTRNRTLTIGGDTTGNIIFNPASTNNVGLGMTVPGSDLQVNGTVAIGFGSTPTTGPTNGLAVNGNINVTAASGLDTIAAGVLNVGNTTATTVSIGGTAATTLNLGAGGALTRTINIGTGTGVDTIHIGDGGTGADVITIGSANAGNVTVQSNAVLNLTGSTNSLINFPNFDVSTAGNITVAGSQGIDTNAAGQLNVGNTTATTVAIGGTAATTLNLGAAGSLTRTINIGTGTGADTIHIGDGATGSDVITIGGGVGTLAINTGDWDITTTGDMSGIGTLALNGTITQTGATGFSSGTGTSTFNGLVNTAQDIDIIPSTTTGTSDLGSASVPWDNLYVNNIFTTGSGVNGYWQRAAGVVAPANITDDLTVGGIATVSAKFQVVALTSGTITAGTASTSGDLTFNGTSATQNINLLKNTRLDIRTSPGGDAGLATKLSITSDGNLGIGTTVPTSPIYLTRSNSLNQNFIGGFVQSSQTTAAGATITGLQVESLFTAASGTQTGATGLQVNPKTTGAGGTVTTMVGLGLFPDISASSTVSTLRMIDLSNPAGAGTINGLIGVSTGALTRGTNNTNVLIGQSTSPSGNYGIYNSSTYQNYFAGNVGIGSTTPGASLNVVSGTAATPLTKLAAGIAPTVDMAQITNSGFGVTTSGVNALSINYTVGSTNAVGWEAAAQRIDLTTGSIGGNTQTVSGLRVVGSTTGSSSITEYGVKIDAITGGSGVEYGLNIGTGWDRGISSASDAYLTKFIDFDGTNYFVDPAATLYSAILNSTVGIGTTAPLGLFNVDGAVTGKALAIFNQNGGNQAVLTASISGATKFLVDSTGNVGISNSTPRAALDVIGSASLSGSLVFGTAGTNTLDVLNGDRFDFRTSPGGDAGLGVQMTLLSNGNLGLSTTAPQTMFHLRGSSTTAIARIESTNTGLSSISTTDPGLELIAAGMNTTSMYTPAIKFMSTDPDFTTTNPKYLAGIIGRATQSYSSDTTGGMALDFLTTPNTPGASSVPTTRLTIDKDGNVGIGTTNPAGLFNVVATTNQKALVQISGTSNSDLLAASLSGTTRFLVDNVGNVGINTTTPSNYLHVYMSNTNTATANMMVENGSTGIAGINFGRVGAAYYTAAVSGTTFRLDYVGTSNASVSTTGINIDNSHNVGIGAVSGGATLDVAGNVQLDITTSSGTWGLCHSGGDINTGTGTNREIIACNGAPSDIAEFMPSVPDAEPGDLMTVISTGDPAHPSRAIKSTMPYDQKVIGVVSTVPTGPHGKPLGSDLYAADQNPKALGLSGRVAVKVSLENGPIKQGDFLTSSSTPGVAMKATKASYVIGRAMEDYDGSIQVSAEVRSQEKTKRDQGILFNGEPKDPQAGIGKIIMVTQTTYFMPEVQLANSGNLNVTGDSSTDTSFEAWAGQYKFESNGGFADAVIARLTAGLVNAQKLVVSGPATFLGTIQAQAINATSLTVNSLTFAGQSLHDYILAVVQSAGFTNNTSLNSPVANIDQINTNIISPLGSAKVQVNGDLAIKKTASAGGNLTVEGNASVSGTLAATDASISGTLRAGHIIADSIDGLEARIASIAANTIVATGSAVTNITNIYNTASNSSTLAASNSGSLTAQSLISANLFTDVADIASLSAHLASVPNLTTETTTVNQGLMVFGSTSLSDTSVVGQLSVDGSLILAENSINVLGATFEIQPLKQGNVSFEGGLVAIDTDGNLTVGGNATFAKDVTVSGKLTASLVSPVPDEDLVISLPGDGTDTTTLAVDRPGVVVKNGSGSAVLKITDVGDVIASGAASASQFQVIRGVAADTSATQTVATASAGTATIKLGQYERTIISPYVTSKSLIYITPVTDTAGVTPFIARQTAEDKATNTKGSFTIRIPVLQSKDVKVNWWIIN